jgi:hypothetical protein
MIASDVYDGVRLESIDVVRGVIMVLMRGITCGTSSAFPA